MDNQSQIFEKYAAPRPQTCPSNHENRNDHLFLIGICIFAALRIAFFNAAFPFFNNVDENQHVDMVIKYALGSGWIPDTSRFDEMTSRWIVLYGSPEYLNTKEKLKHYQPLIPLWRLQNRKDAAQIIEKRTAAWKLRPNHDIYAPPLYYALMGVWYHAGKMIGLNQGDLLYWLKASNIPFFVLLMIISWNLLRYIFPDNQNLRWSILLMLAVFPQDVFYSINSDIPSALLVPLVCLLMIEADKSFGNYRATVFWAMALGGLILTKLSNLPVFAILFLGALWHFFKNSKTVKSKTFWTHVGLFVLISFLPFFAWGMRNLMLTQDVWATAHKINQLGWQVKPLHQIFDHPILTMSGFYIFLSELLKTFWRGEFVWELKRIAFTPMDYFYVFSSIFFCSVALIPSFIKRRSKNMGSPGIFPCFALLILGYLLFLGVLSMRYDFGKCVYPSTAHPYFSSGRLMIGALIPFLVLYVRGLWICLDRFKLSDRFLFVTSGLACAVLVSEVFATLPALSSPFNFFHFFRF